MKVVYESPMMYVEEFVANKAVAACTTQGGIEWTFDCMKGPDTDKGTVVNDTIATGCTNKIGYAAGVKIAYNFAGDRHSNNNSSMAKWGSGRYTGGTDSNYQGKYISVTYSGDIDGLLYADATGHGSFKTDYWKKDVIPGVVAHSKQSSQSYMHHMVAPVVDTTTVNASW